MHKATFQCGNAQVTIIGGIAFLIKNLELIVKNEWGNSSVKYIDCLGIYNVGIFQM